VCSVALVNAEDEAVHLAVQQAMPYLPGVTLEDRVFAFSSQSEGAQTRTVIRNALSVNNQRLGNWTCPVSVDGELSSNGQSHCLMLGRC
jgi:ABC-type histidine transport system ATPase subunit